MDRDVGGEVLEFREFVIEMSLGFLSFSSI